MFFELIDNVFLIVFIHVPKLVLQFVEFIWFLLAMRGELVILGIEVILVTSPQRRTCIEALKGFNMALRTDFAETPGAVLIFGLKGKIGDYHC